MSSTRNQTRPPATRAILAAVLVISGTSDGDARSVTSNAPVKNTPARIDPGVAALSVLELVVRRVGLAVPLDWCPQRPRLSPVAR